MNEKTTTSEKLPADLQKQADEMAAARAKAVPGAIKSRRGTFELPFESLDAVENQAALQQLFARCIVLEATASYADGCVRYIARSFDFEELDSWLKPLEYTALIEAHEDGTRGFKGFVKVK